MSDQSRTVNDNRRDNDVHVARDHVGREFPSADESILLNDVLSSNENVTVEVTRQRAEFLVARGVKDSIIKCSPRLTARLHDVVET
jgi:hypothetical protein